MRRVDDSTTFPSTCCKSIKTLPGSDQDRTLGPPQDESGTMVASLGQTVESIASIVRRQFPVFLVVIPCVMALGLLYLLTTPPAYTAVAKMLIETRKVPAFQQQQIAADQTIDNVAVATQVEVLTSENVSIAVIKDFKLTEDPEFVGSGPGFIGAIFKRISGRSDAGIAQSESEPLRRALTAFEARRKVVRVPQTYAMDISFWSIDAGKAAKIANAISDAYIVDQLEAKYQSTRRASAWLQDRLNNLRTEASAATQAVVDFKQKNNIIESGGKLMNEQQMSEVNTQLVLTRAATAEAKARLDRIMQVMSQDIPDASVADALRSAVVIKLREQYLELAGRQSIWSKKYGPDHLATITLSSQMLQIRHEIADEMQKFAESYKSDYEIALTREESIRKSLDNAVTQSHVTNQAEVQLRELESKAQTSRSMSDNFLQRYMDAVQQQSYPVSEARLITPATPPRSKSHPKTLTVLALSMASSIMIAFGIAVFREASNRMFRTGAQVENVLHVRCLAILPFLKPIALNQEGNAGSSPAAPVRADTSSRRVSHASPPATHPRPTSRSARKSLAEARHIRRSDNLLTYVVDEPFSQFTELLRSVKVTADLNGGVQANRVIGFTSSLPEEGKSTIAANFAAMIAHAGSRVILVDADLRKPRLSESFSPDSSTGLVEVAMGEMALDNALWTDPVSGLWFLPASTKSTRLLHPNEILASTAINFLIGKLRDTFDYIIVDFAPLVPVVDTRTTASFIDSYVYVIEWGRTKIDLVNHSLSNAPEVYSRLLGVVLNKAKMPVVQRYEPYRNSYYYRKYSRRSDVKKGTSL
jgi:succinoglycan biosynthesis transport protein ExoP